MDNLGKNWQLINILFCGYHPVGPVIHYRRKMRAETYTCMGTQPQRVI
jgi:hypothetical protein